MFGERQTYRHFVRLLLFEKRRNERRKKTHTHTLTYLLTYLIVHTHTITHTYKGKKGPRDAIPS